MSTIQNFLIMSVIAFLLSSIVGTAFVRMTINSAGEMSGCPLMSIPALCDMSPLEHAFVLQNMLTAIPSSGLFAFFAALLLALAIVLLAPVSLSILAHLFEPPLGPPTRTGRCIPRHPLQEAFSNGILNPKAF